AVTRSRTSGACPALVAAWPTEASQGRASGHLATALFGPREATSGPRVFVCTKFAHMPDYVTHAQGEAGSEQALGDWRLCIAPMMDWSDSSDLARASG